MMNYNSTYKQTFVNLAVPVNAVALRNSMKSFHFYLNFKNFETNLFS